MNMNLLRALTENLSSADLLEVELMSEVAADISIARITLGMNQKRFAEYMGVTQGMVSKWESGEYNFTLSTLAKIYTKLNISLQNKNMSPKMTVQKDNITSIYAYMDNFYFDIDYDDREEM